MQRGSLFSKGLSYPRRQFNLPAFDCHFLFMVSGTTTIVKEVRLAAAAEIVWLCSF